MSQDIFKCLPLKELFNNRCGGRGQPSRRTFGLAKVQTVSKSEQVAKNVLVPFLPENHYSKGKGFNTFRPLVHQGML